MTNLTECTISNQTTGCSHSQDGGVVCAGWFETYSVCFNVIFYMMLIIADPQCAEGEVRLFNNLSNDGMVMGQVELCSAPHVGGFRTKVCDTDWDDHDAEVVCRELGLQYGRSA